MLLIPSGEILEITYETLKSYAKKKYSSKYGMHWVPDELRESVLSLDKFFRGEGNVKPISKLDTNLELDNSHILKEEDDDDGIMNKLFILAKYLIENGKNNLNDMNSKVIRAHDQFTLLTTKLKEYEDVKEIITYIDRIGSGKFMRSILIGVIRDNQQQHYNRYRRVWGKN